MFFKPKIYSEVSDMYNQAEHLFLTERFEESAAIADRCIPLVDQNRNKLQKWLSENIMLGNLYWWRGRGKEELLKSHLYDFNMNLRDSSLRDYEHAFHYFAGEDRKYTHESLVKLGIDFAEFSVFFVDQSEEEIGKLAIDAIETSIAILEAKRRFSLRANALTLASRVHLNFFARNNSQAELKAVRYLEEAQGEYRRLNEIDYLLENSLELAQAYLLPESRRDPVSIQKLMSLIDEISQLFNDPRLTSPYDHQRKLRARHSIIQGEVFHHLLDGEKSTNLHEAECAYYIGLSFLGEEAAVFSPFTIIYWIRLLIQNDTFESYEDEAAKMFENLTEFVSQMNESSKKSELTFAIIELEELLQHYQNR